MNTPTRLGAVAVIGVVAVGGALLWLSPPSINNGSAPTATSGQPSASASRPVDLDATGILLVGADEQVQARPGGGALSTAFNGALLFSQAHPDDVGYPWIDPSSGELVVSAATPQGRTLLEGASIAVPHRIRDVAHGSAEIQRIQDEVTMLRSQGVIDAQLIYRTMPDQRDNRALITISSMSRPLLEALAGRFPADALAVEMDPSRP